MSGVSKILDIIIVNWNSGAQLECCVKSIIRESMQPDLFNIIIVDNNSSDNSLNFGEANRCLIYRSEENLGFGKACNKALQYCTSNYVLLLNPDTKIIESAIDKSVEWMEGNEEVSVLGVKQINPEGKVGKTCARIPGFWIAIWDIIGLSKTFPKIFKPLIMIDWDHLDSRVVDHVMGSYMLIRRSVIDRTGFFDETFFLYREDLDLSKRIIEKKGLTYYSSTIKIMHVGGGTSNQVKALRLFYSIDSNTLYYKKHFSSLQFTFVKALILFVEPIIRFAKAAIQLRAQDIKELFLAYKWYYKKHFLK